MQQTNKQMKASNKNKKPNKQNSVSQQKSAPVARSKVIKKLGRPTVTPLGKAGDVLVVHKEFIGDLTSSAVAAVFQAVGIPINAGNSAMFPWLSQIAVNFESYVFRSLKFLFETDAATTTPGSLLLAVDYDAHEDLPTDKQEMMSRRDAQRSPVWNACVVDCKKEDLHKRKTYYVGNSAVPSSSYQLVGSNIKSDDRLENVGEFIAASSNCTSTAQLGELYVEYEIELLTPDSSFEPAQFFAMFAQNSTGGPAMTILQPFGDSSEGSIDLLDVNPSIFSTLGVRYSASATKSRFYFAKPGTYFYEALHTNWTTTATFPLTVASSGNSGIINFQKAVSLSAGTGAAAANVMSSGYIVVEPATADPATGDIGYINWELLGTGAAPVANCSSIFRIALVPDYLDAGTGTGVLPEPHGPVGSHVSYGKRRRCSNRPVGLEHVLGLDSPTCDLAEVSTLEKEKDFPLFASSPPSKDEGDVEGSVLVDCKSSVVKGRYSRGTGLSHVIQGIRGGGLH
jgi:hypothetical protein